jgi:hypothetical protein
VQTTTPSTPQGTHAIPASSPIPLGADDSPTALAVNRRKALMTPDPAQTTFPAITAATDSSSNEPAATTPSRKRPRTNDSQVGDDIDNRSTGVAGSSVSKGSSGTGDNMETDSLDTIVLTPTASTTQLPTRPLSPRVEKLADDAVAANKLVLDHLMAQAAKHVQKAAQRAPPPPPEPALPETAPDFTPTPKEKFPVVHGRTSTRIFDNLDHAQASVWLTLDAPHVFVQPLDHGFYPPHIAPEMVHLVRDAIQLALGITGIKVTAPSPYDTVDRLDKAPFTYLVHGMSVSDANKLAAQYCLASKSISLLVYKAGIQAPTYIGSIEGLTIDDDEDHVSVLELVAETYLHGPVGAILAEISAPSPSLEHDNSTSDHVHAILQTLTGHRLEMNSTSGSKRVNFNIYIKSPTDDDSD